MGYTRQLGQLAYLITYDGSGNITVPASLTQGSVTSSMLKTDVGGKLVAAVAGTDYVAPSALSSYVPTSRTITINGTAYDLSADRSWSIVSGVSSFNTRTGAITLTSGDVTTALGYTPVTNARTITINGTTYDLSADRSWSIVSGVSSFNTRTGAITLTSLDVTGALGYTPVTNARTITINGTTYDLSADRSWSIVSGVSSFNTRTGAITLTSGDVTTALTYTPVTNARTITINGTAYDLSADRTWVVDASSVTTRVIQKFTATSSQTTFTITGGYTVGMVDVFLNGIKLDNATEFTATDSSTVVLASAAATGDIVEVYKYGGQFIANNTLRQSTLFTATAGQTTFTVNYSVGFVDVFYNGSKLDSSEFTATNGTSIILGTACVLNDKVEVIAYNYTVGAFTGVGGSGTAGTIAKWTASGTLGNSVFVDNNGYLQINATSNNSFITTNGTNNVLGICANSTLVDGTTRIEITGSTYPSTPNTAFIRGNTIVFTQNNASSESMRITSSGLIGIGMNNPVYELDVTATSYKVLRLQSNDDVIVTMGSSIASSQYWTYGATSNSSGQGSNLFFIGTSTNNPSGTLTKNLVISSSGLVSQPTQPVSIGGLVSDQSISATTFTILNFDTGTGYMSRNIGSGWNNSTRTFTALATGTYAVSVSVYTNCIGQVAMFINGGRTISVVSGTAISGNTTWSGECMVYLSSGDALTLRGYGDSGGTLYANGFHTWFQIRFLG